METVLAIPSNLIMFKDIINHHSEKGKASLDVQYLCCVQAPLFDN